MKKNYFVKYSFSVFILLSVVACRQKQTNQHVHHSLDTNLVSVVNEMNTHINKNVTFIKPATGMKIFNVQLNGRIVPDTRERASIASRVEGRIERLLIKYNYQPVKKGELIMEIYSPELATAQKELIYVARKREDIGLINRAEQRLQLLGMRKEEINKILVTGEIIYRVPVFSNFDGYIFDADVSLPESGNNPVSLREGQYVKKGQSLFNIYANKNIVAEFAIPANLVTKVRRGQRVLLHAQDKKNNMFIETIGLVEPVFRNGQSFSNAKVYLEKSEWLIGQLLTANAAVVYTDSWWLPVSAVRQQGTTALVYRKNGNHYSPVHIDYSGIVNGMVESKTNMTGWEIVSNAAYLNDSEAFIQPK